MGRQRGKILTNSLQTFNNFLTTFLWLKLKFQERKLVRGGSHEKEKY